MPIVKSKCRLEEADINQPNGAIARNPISREKPGFFNFLLQKSKLAVLAIGIDLQLCHIEIFLNHVSHGGE